MEAPAQRPRQHCMLAQRQDDSTDIGPTLDYPTLLYGVYIIVRNHACRVMYKPTLAVEIKYTKFGSKIMKKHQHR